jgi:5-methylthioadenosine/S-adenosylhomocysteine deaminase
LEVIPVKEVDLLLTGGYVVVSSGQVIGDGAVAISGDRVVEVGGRKTVTSAVRAARTIDTTGRAVLPGLINAHNHTCQSTARGLADDLPVTDWLSRIVPFEATLEAEDVRASVRLACVEMIKSGTTGVMEGCATPGHENIVGEVFVESGLRGVLTRSTMEHADTTWAVPPSFLISREDNVKATRAMLERWNGAGDGRIAAWPSFRHAQDVSDDLILDLVKLMEEFGVGLHAHQSTRSSGELDHLDEIGAIHENMVFAHGIRYSRRELQLIRSVGIKINHNPGGSLHGAYGSSALGYFPEMLRMGIPVALGNDGAANNNTLDMFREMLRAATIHSEARIDATAVTAADAFDMGTVFGARACMWSDAGTVAVGNKADVIVVNVTAPHMVPHHDLISNFVYCANGHDVETTIVDGRVLMENRQVLAFDEDSVIADAVASADSVASRWRAAGHGN